MKKMILNHLKRRSVISVSLACISFFCGMSQKGTAETVTLSDYMTPNGERSTWIYSRSQKGAQQDLATRMTVVEDHYLFGMLYKFVWASQKLEERGTWKSGSFEKFTGAKREATYTYTDIGDRYRIYGIDQPVIGSPEQTENRLRFTEGFGVGPTMEIGEMSRKRSLVYSADRQLGYTDFTMELLGKSSVSVAAGTFRDCIHLRFSIGLKTDVEVGEEWWAKGVGLVKWKGISGEQAGISEELVFADIKKVIPYSPPGLKLTSNHLYQIGSGTNYHLRFPPVFIPGTKLERKITLRNTGSEPLKGVAVKLAKNPYFKMDPFDTRELKGGQSVVLTIRFTVPTGYFSANSILDIQCDNREIDPLNVYMSITKI